MGDFSHLTRSHEAEMVDVSLKQPTQRSALVKSQVSVGTECAELLQDEAVKTIIATAKIAGIQAAKQTALLVPLCHQIPLQKVTVSITWNRDEGLFSIAAEAKTQALTGVEMEAMVAAQIAAITIYDMIKAVDPEATLGPTYLNAKMGGKSGQWQRERAPFDISTST